MASVVSLFTIKQEELHIRLDECMRYLGYRKDMIRKEDEEMVKGYIDKIRLSMEPKACYRRFPVKVYGDGNITMPYGDIYSESLTRNLGDSEEIIFMAVTLGPSFDRSISRAVINSITEAACYQSIGGAAVEALCEALVAHINDELLIEGKKLRPRFSPGFSDYPLDNQKGIFACLNPEKYIGVTLMESLVMAPEKSVTAVIGIQNEESK